MDIGADYISVASKWLSNDKFYIASTYHLGCSASRGLTN
jgi:hypothetical protein